MPLEENRQIAQELLVLCQAARDDARVAAAADAGPTQRQLGRVHDP